MDNQDQRDISPDASLAGDPRWLLVQRIVASPGFVNSQRLSAFLLYVSEQTLRGRGDALNERLIGEMVFERSRDYDPRDDNIVRSHASRLRARLEEYFEREGASERLKVSIPRGSYAPVFEETKLLLEPASVSARGSATETPVQDDVGVQKRVGRSPSLKVWGVSRGGFACDVCIDRRHSIRPVFSGSDSVAQDVVANVSHRTADPDCSS